MSTSSPTLRIAIGAADDVGNSAQRAAVLAIIAEGYLATQSDGEALLVATEAARLINDIPLSTETVPLQMQIAELLLSADEPNGARRLITEATIFTEALLDEAAQVDLLPVVIRAAMAGGDATRDLLPAAVDPAYVIEDTGLRAQSFISIAETFQLMGANESVAGLIHQAIPAIRSVADPYRRAELFGQLSFRAYASGEYDLAHSLAIDAEEQLNIGIVEDDPDPQIVAVVLSAITLDRGAAGALSVMAEIQNPLARASGYLALAIVGGSDPSAELGLSRAIDVANDIVDSESYALLMASISHAYLSIGLRPEALQAAELAAARLAGNQSRNSETLSRLAGAYVLLDQPTLLRNYLVQIEDRYLRGVVSVEVAELFINEGRQGVADDFLVDALVDANAADLFSDTLRERIAQGFVRSGSYSLAIRTIGLISDRYLRARAVAILGSHADREGGLSESQLRNLRESVGE